MAGRRFLRIKTARRFSRADHAHSTAVDPPQRSLSVAGTNRAGQAAVVGPIFRVPQGQAHLDPLGQDVQLSREPAGASVAEKSSVSTGRKVLVVTVLQNRFKHISNLPHDNTTSSQKTEQKSRGQVGLRRPAIRSQRRPPHPAPGERSESRRTDFHELKRPIPHVHIRLASWIRRLRRESSEADTGRRTPPTSKHCIIQAAALLSRIWSKFFGVSYGLTLAAAAATRTLYAEIVKRFR